MRKVLMLSAAFALFSSIVIAQDAKVQKVEPKVQKQAPKVQKQETKVVKPVTKDQKLDAKTQKQDVKNEEKSKGYHKSDWDKKIIAELKLSPEQIAKFEEISKDFYERAEALKETKVKAAPRQSTVSAAVEQSASESPTSVNVDSDLLKQNAEGENMKKDKNEKLEELQIEKEKMFIELLTPEQQALYIKMLENKEKEPTEKKKEVNQKKVTAVDPDN